MVDASLVQTPLLAMESMTVPTTKEIVQCGGSWCYDTGECGECGQVVTFIIEAAGRTSSNGPGTFCSHATLPDGRSVEVVLIRRPLSHERTINVPVYRVWRFCPACGNPSTTQQWADDDMESRTCDSCLFACNECVCEAREW